MTLTILVNRTPYSALLQYAWGDVFWPIALTRTILKVALALLLALIVHEGFLVSRLEVSKEDSEALAKAFNTISSDSRGITNIHPSKDADYKRVYFCLEAKQDIVGGCARNPAETTRLSDREVVAGLGYKIFGATSNSSSRLLTSGVFFHVEKHAGLVSQAHIEESIDTLLRRLELALYNSPNAHASDIKLCTGTRSLLTGAECEQTGKVGYQLGADSADLISANPSLARNTLLPDIISRLRIASMFIGPVQFGTLAIFFYAMIETVGLWLRWVAPPDRIKNLAAERVAASLRALRRNRVRSIRDRLMVAAMEVVKRADDVGPKDEDKPTNLSSKLAPRTEFVEVLSSYRDFLHEEAVGRQDALEMLGDAMLKLAFLGTVYGISAALFSARGLDTADPILKLSTKAAMYAGIGLGFGATILGIACSIIAGVFRSSLAAGWSREIGAAYQMVLETGIPKLTVAVEATNREEIVDVLDVPPSPGEEIPASSKLGTTELLGLLVLLAIGLLAAYLFRDKIGEGFTILFNHLGGSNV